MTSRDFAYWLQGFFEITDPAIISFEQIKMIKRHLNMVFIHEIDPSFSKEQQKPLNDAHKAPEPPKFPVGARC